MTENEQKDPDYTDDETKRLEVIWSEDFLSSGGAAEVSSVLGDHNIAGCDILDVGSGPDWVEIVLFREHGAGTVMGIDVDKNLVELATQYWEHHALEDRIKYQLVKPGRLPFFDETFDVVFSKDAIIHVSDKFGLNSDSFRLMQPGGRPFVSDWLRGEGDKYDGSVGQFVEASGDDFNLVYWREIGEVTGRIGFTDIDLTDRRDWYLEEAKAELNKMRGPLKAHLHEEIEFWEMMLGALNEGAIRPGHIRAVKPLDTRWKKERINAF